MVSRHASDEALIYRQPEGLAGHQEWVQAWIEWQAGPGESILARFVRVRNTTGEADEDIIQDALLTAYLGLASGRYQPRAGVPFTAYVIGIARNKIREARRRERRMTMLDDEREDALHTQRASGQWFERQPERRLEQREQRELVRSGLSRLPADRRLVLEQYLSGASTEEIAARLAMSQALVRQHKCRGLRALQRDLQRMGWIPQAV
jgi:RNA polymerase sigma factor (sigma-70 family)